MQWPINGDKMKLRDFLTRDRWCQGAYARDIDGWVCRATDSIAHSFCLMGAMIVCYPDPTERLMVQDRFASLIRILHRQRIKDFNDSADWEDIEHILECIDA